MVALAAGESPGANVKNENCKTNWLKCFILWSSPSSWMGGLYLRPAQMAGAAALAVPLDAKLQNELSQVIQTKSVSHTTCDSLGFCRHPPEAFMRCLPSFRTIRA